jgi:hypothetical protein
MKKREYNKIGWACPKHIIHIYSIITTNPPVLLMHANKKWKKNYNVASWMDLCLMLELEWNMSKMDQNNWDSVECVPSTLHCLSNRSQVLNSKALLYSGPCSGSVRPGVYLEKTLTVCVCNTSIVYTVPSHCFRLLEIFCYLKPRAAGLSLPESTLRRMEQITRGVSSFNFSVFLLTQSLIFGCWQLLCPHLCK